MLKLYSIVSLIFIMSLSVNALPVEYTKGFKKFKLTPINDSLSDKDFSQFIKNFIKDVKDKNIESLKKSIAPDVRWTFGEDEGIKSFLKSWELDKNPKNSEFWDEMGKVLSMGSAFYNEEKTSFAFPYLFVTFPSDYDPFQFAAVTGNKVNVRKSPSSKSTVIETLDYEIVKRSNPEEAIVKEKIDGINGSWIKIITSTGKEGYIFSQFIHSPVEYRAIFEKRNNKWMLTVFIAGD